jgi:hypothetical protein
MRHGPAQLLRLHDAPTHTVASDSTGIQLGRGSERGFSPFQLLSLSCRAAAARDLPAANSEEPLPLTLPPTPTSRPVHAKHSTAHSSPVESSPAHFRRLACWPHSCLLACPCVPPRSRPTPTAASQHGVATCCLLPPLLLAAAPAALLLVAARSLFWPLPLSLARASCVGLPRHHCTAAVSTKMALSRPA